MGNVIVDNHPDAANPTRDPSASRSEDRLRLLFIHHSVGSAWLADPGSGTTVEGAPGVYRAHPCGGGLRSRLEEAGYEVHQASFGSHIGARTDLFDWLDKFRADMSRILTVDFNDRPYGDGRRNDVVVFKSCFPNNDFVGRGAPPGSAAGPELTVWNARATMQALRDEFRRHPDVLFVYVTAPPLAPHRFHEKWWKQFVKRALGVANWSEQFERRAILAREFNAWVAGSEGWLGDDEGRNVAVFDLFDVLTGEGASNFLQYPTTVDGAPDSHPSAEGNRRATEAFVPLLQRVVRRAGLARR